MAGLDVAGAELYLVLALEMYSQAVQENLTMLRLVEGWVLDSVLVCSEWVRIMVDDTYKHDFDCLHAAEELREH